MNAYERELKLSKNVTPTFCNHFSVSRIFQVIWHAKCLSAIVELKFQTQILNPLKKKRKISKNCN